VDALIGYTGFVGANILKGLSENTAVFNTQNIAGIHGQHFETLYISAIQAKKWWANQNPVEDKKRIDDLFAHLKQVSADKVVFISTVDVYQPPVDADEDTPVSTDIHAYGANRLHAETLAQSLFSNVFVIRLQGLVASNLTKNVVFDLKNKNILDTINPASTLQWYPLSRLNKDISTVIAKDLKLVNLSVEPLTTQQIIDFAPLSDDERAIVASNPSNKIAYDVTSKYASLFGGRDGYIVGASESLNEIKRYFNE
tara:strand:- start:551 stop:1315 length:765 start_codon:yes stop_codon:yes gene_type:complete